MSTIVQIEINSDISKALAEDLIDKAFLEFDYVIKKFSRFDPQSELNQLNRHSGEFFRVSEELFTLIELALQASKESGDVFDPTIIDLLKTYGYDKSYNPENIVRKLDKPGFKKDFQRLLTSRPKPRETELDQSNQAVKLQKGQKIDLGAIGKGYAIDLARKVLERNGISDFLINAGGDIFGRSVSADKPKTAALFDPRNPDKSLGNIKLYNSALAGSGNFARKIGIFQHIINPLKGTKSQNSDILQTYVIAPTATEADLYSTVLFLTGKSGLDLIHQKGYQGLVISNSGLKGNIDIIGN